MLIAYSIFSSTCCKSWTGFCYLLKPVALRFPHSCYRRIPKNYVINLSLQQRAAGHCRLRKVSLSHPQNTGCERSKGCQ